jgi:hypothetical protein
VNHAKVLPEDAPIKALREFVLPLEPSLNSFFSIYRKVSEFFDFRFFGPLSVKKEMLILENKDSTP